MSATLIDGKAISELKRQHLKTQVRELSTQAIIPGLAAVIVGDDPASHVYVRNKVKACDSVGVYSEKHMLPVETTEEALRDLIQQLNADRRIHGILVQLPLPEQINESVILDSISPEKDVDGFHYYNVGAMVTGNARFIPCTPAGIQVMINEMAIDTEGKEAVVIGRSNIVGKPMAMLLLEMNATVTICTSRTHDLVSHTLRADILVVATGRPQMITGDMIKPGATVIDVGINRLGDGKLVGDVDFNSAKEVAGHITPVPGGVGPMTITMLLSNTVLSARRSL